MSSLFPNKISFIKRNGTEMENRDINNNISSTNECSASEQDMINGRHNL